MNPKRRKRLIITLSIVLVAAVIISLVLFALKQNINLFYAPTQVAEGEAPVGQRIRVGGMVEKGSVQRSEDSLAVRFKVTDYQHSVTVVYAGILPDLFREEQGIIALGQMNEQGVFQADEVLAKHDENYMPPEVAESLKPKGVTP
ncbi:MAG: cytochrome c maturation protein CcmE [Methylococcales bacterium]|nr:cytochrome c maturation protein CcmE [Methylococcales bacterium]